jgi:signal transduction histidine kinase
MSTRRRWPGDILDLSRIEADRLPLYKTDCPLQQILDEVMAVAKIAAAKKRLSLQVAYSLPVPATIYTDAARLRQILVNLVGNAVKFTEHGEVSLTVRCGESGEGTARVQFVVSDTGIGIPSDKLDEIFQPFVQVDASNTRRYGGTGLGLSICQRLAQALDGRLEVTSELGRGSTFTLTIDASCLAPRTRRDATGRDETGRAMTTSRNKYIAGSQP